ncbi:MAG: hypothetical protein AB1726_05465 [Planctomycetota bacterium]
MRRRTLVALALALATLLALLLLDGAISLLVLPRTWRPAPPFGAITNPEQRRWLEEQLASAAADPATGLGRFDPVLGWSFRPLAVGRGGTVHINSRGWRGAREYAAEPAPGVVRIVACGDSFTFGEEVADEDAWTARLESGWPDVEVINLGVGGYGTDQAFLRFQAEDVGARIDVVLIGLLLENIGRNVNRYRPLWFPRTPSPAAKPRFLREDGTLRLLELPFATQAEFVAAVASGEVCARLAEGEFWSDEPVPAWLAWSGIARLVGMRRAYAARELPRLWRDVDGEPFRVTLALLAAFHRHAIEARGARLAPVLVFPTREDLAGLAETGERTWNPLLDALAAQGIDCLDLSASLADADRARAPGDPPLYGASHLSPRGNEVVARAVRAWVEPRLGE